VNGWTLLFSALGVALFLEGLPYFVSPAAVRRAVAVLVGMSDRALRAMGLSLMLAGLAVAYAALH
jgi:uncharacterized protein YjeT (DUF2065 family)